MQLLKKIFIIAAVLLPVLFLAAYLLVRDIATKALPDYNQDLTLEGLRGQVTVIRDSHAVPAIYAECENDLYRAVGYVMAQDRLWQMDLLRRASTGRLSEIFGEDFTDTDLLVRSLRIPEKSAMVLDSTHQPVIDALEAFAHGVNQFIDHNSERLPPEFSILRYRPEKWEPAHSVNLLGYMAWETGGEWSTLLILHSLQQKLDEDRFRELIPDLDLQKSLVHPRFRLGKTALRKGLFEPSAKIREMGLNVFSGSNSWAVSGDKSTTGNPLFAHDMHLFYSAPGTWYQMHHIIEGRLNVTGVVLPGQPLVIAGHNERIAWGMTSAMVDDTDFYLETINPQNPHQYKFMGRWRDMEARREVIGTGKKKYVEREILYTHRGPVIPGFTMQEGKAVSMKWLGNSYSNELRSVWLLNRAGNWEEFREAVSSFISISQNITYADVDGNIGIQTAAGIPLRKGNDELVVPGGSDTYDWRGLVPFDELPFTYNPPEGFVIASNNRAVSGDYPYYVGRWFDTPNRYDRIKEMLLEKDLLSVEDFKRMLGDKKSKLAERMMPVLLEEMDRMPPAAPNGRRAIKKLREWDMVYNPSSSASLIFEKFYIRFLENLLLEEMGEELFGKFLSDKILARNIVDLVWDKRHSAWLREESRKGSRDDHDAFTRLVHKSFNEAIGWIEHNLGTCPSRWAWGGASKLKIAHPMGQIRLLDMIFSMNRGPYAPGGSFHTVCPYGYNIADPFRIVHGASHRHIYTTANWDESLSIVPTGTSGIPASDYYCDQTLMYVNDSYRPDRFSAAQVERAARYRMRLVPAD